MGKKKKKTRRLLLKNVADALNACERAGIDIKFQAGIVCSEYGYVLPVKGRWVARTRRVKTWKKLNPYLASISPEVCGRNPDKHG